MGEKYVKGDDVYERGIWGDTKIGTINDTGWFGGKEFVPKDEFIKSHHKVEKIFLGDIKITTDSSLLSSREKGYTITKDPWTGTQHSQDWDTSETNKNGEKGSSSQGGGSGSSSSSSYGGGSSSSSSGFFGPVLIFFGIVFFIVVAGAISEFTKIEPTPRYTPAVEEPKVEAPSPAIEEPKEEVSTPVAEEQKVEEPSPVVEESIPQPEEKAVEQVQMTRNLDIALPYALPPGTRIEVWALENGVKTRSLHIASTSQQNGMLHIILAEEIPISTHFNVSWFIPQSTVNSRPIIITRRPPPYMPRQHMPYRGDWQHRYR